MTDNVTERLKRILRFAMDNERLSTELYRGLAKSNAKPRLARLCMRLACEEEEHLAKLSVFLASPMPALPDPAALRRIEGEDCSAPDGDPRSLDAVGLLRFALAKEAAAHQLYTDLAEASREPSVKKLFTSLAEQEGAHRDRFELELERLSGPEK
ncbi:MAG: ferritin family protein [Elusimicrobia bacterium]|nr:ferritin family protein [Elusimicrobiota bacterium]